MRIAVDAMGGDNAPGPIVAGAVQAAATDGAVTVVLVGDRERIDSELDRLQADRSRLVIEHAPQVVGMDETPTEGLKKKPDNSISRCWKLMALKEVDAIVSAGNTGAMVAGGLMTKKFLPHVRRPGIATAMPTAKGPCLIVDVGANVAPKPVHLFQYGVMGSIFARLILGREKPTIGLINVGEESAKGHDLAKETHDLFRNGPLKDQFIGNIEGRDIHRGAADVVVTDGFTGNVILKLSQGVLEFIVKLIGMEVLSVLQAERQVAADALKAMLQKYHYSAFGGAPLLGVNGICIICHGSSDDRAIRNAVGMAVKYARERVNDRIVAELDRVPTGGDD